MGFLFNVVILDIMLFINFNYIWIGDLIIILEVFDGILLLLMICFGWGEMGLSNDDDVISVVGLIVWNDVFLMSLEDMGDVIVSFVGEDGVLSFLLSFDFVII